MSYKNNKKSGAYASMANYNSSTYGAQRAMLSSAAVTGTFGASMTVPRSSTMSYNALQHNVRPSGSGYFTLGNAYSGCGGIGSASMFATQNLSCNGVSGGAPSMMREGFSPMQMFHYKPVGKEGLVLQDFRNDRTFKK